MNHKRTPGSYSIVWLALVFVGLGLSAHLGATESAAPSPSPSPESSAASQAAIVVPKNTPEDIKKMIEELARHRQALEAKERELEAKTAELSAKEKALEGELTRLKEVREDITRVESDQIRIQEEKIAKLVETLEVMSPAAGSKMLSEINEQLAVEVMARISTPKLSKLMAKMDPEKSSRLGERLAGIRQDSRRSVASTGAPEVKSQSAKGGEKNDGQPNQHQPNQPGNSAAGSK